jgi:hypothetical protein
MRLIGFLRKDEPDPPKHCLPCPYLKPDGIDAEPIEIEDPPDEDVDDTPSPYPPTVYAQHPNHRQDP